MTLDNLRGDSKSVKSEMDINFANMELKSKDEHNLKFISVEHTGNS